jgi:hypothetical protein
MHRVLSDNQLTGKLPEFFTGIFKKPDPTVDVSGNNLSGLYPPGVPTSM